MQHTNKFLTLVNKAKQQIKEVNIAQAQQLIAENSDLLVIDVREDNEWARGHLPNATHLSKGVIERDIEKVVADTTKPLLLYCGGGYRSALAAVNLKNMGYENVISMDGGFGGWVNAGLPVEN